MQVALASEFMWNWNQREATAAVGYDYTLRQCRLRGRADTEGEPPLLHLGCLVPDKAAPAPAHHQQHIEMTSRSCSSVLLVAAAVRSEQAAHMHNSESEAHTGKFSAFLEERINVGVNFLLSAEIDHVKKDYKFGFGLTVGE